jgi:hypothetical protein
MKRFVRDEGSIGDLWFLDSKSGRSSLIFGSIWLTLTTRQNDSGTFAACPETVAFTVPFPTPLPLTQTCSQAWMGLEIPEYLQGF